MSTKKIPRLRRKSVELSEWSLISRKRALRLGLPNYYDPGDPAPCGCDGPRRAITNMCIPCAQAYQSGGFSAATVERAGLKFHDTYMGKPCNKGHGGRRRVKTRECVECVAIARAAMVAARLAKRSNAVAA